MTARATTLLWGVAVFSWPAQAHAQRIPDIVIVLGMMPLLGAAFAIVLGILRRSWLAGAGNFALVVLWVAWFTAAAMYSRSDWMNWAPIGVLGLHLVAMACLIGWHAFRRLTDRR